MVKVAKKAKKTSKTSRKDLKGPDQFVEATTKGAEKVGEYRNHIIFGSLAVVILMGAVYFFQNYQASQQTTVTSALTKALKIYNAKISKTRKSSEDEPVFKTSKARYEAAVKAFDKAVKTVGNTNAGALSHLYLGHSHAHLGAYKKAVGHYETFLKRVSNKDPLYFLGLDGYAKALQALGKPKDGLARLQSYKDKGAKPLQPFALMRLAEYYQAKKDYKRARALYNELTKLKSASSDFKTTASRRLAVLP